MEKVNSVHQGSLWEIDTWFLASMGYFKSDTEHPESTVQICILLEKKEENSFVFYNQYTQEYHIIVRGLFKIGVEENIFRLISDDKSGKEYFLVSPFSDVSGL